MLEIAGIVLTSVEACYKVATSINNIIENYSNAHTFVAELRRTCEQTRRHMRHLRSALDQGPLAEDHDEPCTSILETYYAAHDEFDLQLDSMLRELKGFRFDQQADGLSGDVSSRMQMVWKRPHIEDMKRDILYRSSSMQLLLVTIQMQTQSLMHRRYSLPGSEDERQKDLLEAVSRGDEARARRLLGDRTPTGQYSYQEFSTTPLHVAAEGGTESLITLLLENGADINKKNSAGATPLMRAIYMERKEAAFLLINRGAEVNGADKLGKTALHIAVKGNQIGVVKQLLQGDAGAKTADPNAQDMFEETPLGEALRLNGCGRPGGDRSILLALLDAGANPTLGNKILYTPLHMAADKNFIPELESFAQTAVALGPGKLNMKMLFEPSTGLYGETPLWLAARGGNVEAVRILLELGADPSIACENAEHPSPLWAAYAAQRLDIAKMLLLKRANPNHVDKSGRTILHRTWCSNSEQWTSLLTSYNARAGGIRDKKGCEPVHYAAMAGQQRILAMLVAGGASLDTRDGENWTPLMTAAANSNPRLTMQLLSHGASWDIEDDHGTDAFYHACMVGDIASAGYLLMNGGGRQLNKPNHKGITPLHVAAKQGKLEMVGWLLRHGADKMAMSREPFDGSSVVGTPMQVARETGHDEIAGFIDEFTDDGGAPVWDVELTRSNGRRRQPLALSPSITSESFTTMESSVLTPDDKS